MRSDDLIGVGPPAGGTCAEGHRTDDCRSDAARNREHLLATARGMLDATGVAGLTMDALAREAGLGKGTVFRRFGSRQGLLEALLDDTETEFQRAFLSGPPPLGPGADPVDRLVAFGRGRLSLVTVQGELLCAVASSPEGRYSSAVRAASRMHVQMLLRQTGSDVDVEVLAFHLLAVLDAGVIHHESTGAGLSLDRLADGWEQLVRRVVGSA
ncbi:TetR/AcrR family transcriptional regulator [Sanguibacter suaedae]|uniref:TetR/AcrR family transcriptional regulator n=1 Tax=Sanguibacter suaedae TaxID=2795737 RepID=A0A934IF13_9MICO|nr:TetR/AcrR family transcriptional regulator [Sanguibacter suaedae]MBI9115749.1 TetR/AcrR family transcriptional regulator [Sanguibacter suaedae]